MKSLLSIITKLSQNEVETFRAYLVSHCRNGNNKKLELFESLVKQSAGTSSSITTDVTRQSAYQLKKRLQEELYSFLITQYQAKDSNNQFFLEMDCHKKLYCFKILLDKGVTDHAHQMLKDVINIASRHSLHSLYLEAVHLRNTHFPSEQTTVKKIPVEHQIKKLKKSLSRNLFVNQYLLESKNFLHESDQVFRERFISRLKDFELAENEFVIEELLHVNQMLSKNDFVSAYNKLQDLIQEDTDIVEDPAMLSLVYTDMIKVCICLSALEEAGRWVEQSHFIFAKCPPFTVVLQELQYIISLRSGDTEKAKTIADIFNKTKDGKESEELIAKWSFYSLLIDFQQGLFKKVIKTINGTPALLFKNKSWLLNVKMLEILCIYQLEDIDWLYYKIESFRKLSNTTDPKHQRISHIVNLLKIQAGTKPLTAYELEDKIQKIEQDYPWHSLSVEMVDYCSYVRKMVGVASYKLQDA